MGSGRFTVKRGSWGESEVILRPEALQWKGWPGGGATSRAGGGGAELGAPTAAVEDTAIVA